MSYSICALRPFSVSALHIGLKLLKLNIKFAVAYNNLGLVYRDLDDLKNAEESFLKSIEIDPNNGDPYNNLGLIYYNANDTIKAEEFFKKSLNFGWSLTTNSGSWLLSIVDIFSLNFAIVH